MSRYSPTVAPNSGEAFGRALQQSVSAYLGARQQKEQDEADMLGRGYMPAVPGQPQPAASPPSIDQNALQSLVAKNTPEPQQPTQAGQAFGQMLGAQAMPIQVAQSRPEPQGATPQALAKAAGLDAYQPQQPAPVHLYGRDWQMTPQAIASMQASQAMALANLEDKRAGTAKTYREIAKPQLGDAGYSGAMADVAGRTAAATAPIEVNKAIETERGVGPLRAQNATAQAIATAKGTEPIEVQKAVDISHGTLGDRSTLAGITASGTAKRAEATNLNSILDDYHRDAADFDKARAGYEVLKGALKNRGMATPFSVLDAYARVVNPGAVVRQGTMNTLKEMGSYDQRINRWLSMAQSGQWPEDMLSSIKNTIDGIMQEHYQTYKQTAESRAVQRGKASGIDMTPYLSPAMPEFEQKGPARDPGGDINLGDTTRAGVLDRFGITPSVAPVRPDSQPAAAGGRSLPRRP